MSGIYIPGMEMPIGGCANCIFSVTKRCLINLAMKKKTTVTHSCPLVPVPEHKRPLVDALEVINAFPEKVIFTNEQARALTNYIIPAEPPKEE